VNNTTSIYQDAIRLLFLLVFGAEEFEDQSDSTLKGVFKGKARLYALDFWVRYPDYFAHELLAKFKETGDVQYFQKAEDIFQDNEPDLRRIPMIRYLFGAYENFDNTLAILISKGLVIQAGSKTPKKIQHYDFIISKKAYEVVDEASTQFPILRWYEDRAKLVISIAGDRAGHILKNRQYEHIEYAKTKLGGVIPSIKEEIQEQLIQLKKSFKTAG